MRILAPRIRLAAFRHHRAELRIGQHVRPGRRRLCAFARGDHVFAPVGRKTTEAIFQDQRALWRLVRHAALFAGRILQQRRHAQHGARWTLDLFGQGAAQVADDGARHRLQQDAVFVGNLLGQAHENAARAVDRLRIDARGDQAHDLVVQQLAVARLVLVPDHQIDDQSFQAPVGMRLHHLARQFDIGRVAYLQQHDGQVAGNGIRPQAGLAALVLDKDAGLGAQGRIRVDHGIGQACIQLRVRFAGIQLAQHHLAVRPGQFEHAVGQVAILVFVDQVQRRLALLHHAGHAIDRDRLVGFERDDVTDGHDGVEHGTVAATERPAVLQRLRQLRRVAAADEARAIRLERHGIVFDIVHRHHMQQPRHLFILRAGPARA